MLMQPKTNFVRVTLTWLIEKKLHCRQDVWKMVRILQFFSLILSRKLCAKQPKNSPKTLHISLKLPKRA